jgi:hypothetical protein
VQVSAQPMKLLEEGRMYRIAYATEPIVHSHTGRKALDLWPAIFLWNRGCESGQSERVGIRSVAATARSEDVDSCLRRRCQYIDGRGLRGVGKARLVALICYASSGGFGHFLGHGGDRWWDGKVKLEVAMF